LLPYRFQFTTILDSFGVYSLSYSVVTQIKNNDDDNTDSNNNEELKVK